MIITELGFYKTRGGDKVEVVAIRDNIAVVFTQDNLSYTVYELGSYSAISDMRDIIEKWQEPKPPVVFEGWININGAKDIRGIYKDKDLADFCESLYRIDCLHIRYDSSKPLKERITVIGE